MEHLSTVSQSWKILLYFFAWHTEDLLRPRVLRNVPAVFNFGPNTIWQALRE
jgi:hypothetical protein